jgi:hypothetical protein
MQKPLFVQKYKCATQGTIHSIPAAGLQKEKTELPSCYHCYGNGFCCFHGLCSIGDGLYYALQIAGVDGLYKVIVDTAVGFGLFYILRVDGAGYYVYEHRVHGWYFGELVQELPAIPNGHVDVEENDIGHLLVLFYDGFEAFECFLAVLVNHEVVAKGGELHDFAGAVNKDGVIVYNTGGINFFHASGIF